MDILDYNYLIANQDVAYSLQQYIIHIIPKYFPEYKLDMIMAFITLNSKEDHTIIDEEYLKICYLKLDPIKYVKKYNLIRNLHFIIENNKYKFTPEAFKNIILKEPNNTFKEYFIIIEKCMYYYIDYQYKAEEKINRLINSI